MLFCGSSPLQDPCCWESPAEALAGSGPVRPEEPVERKIFYRAKNRGQLWERYLIPLEQPMRSLRILINSAFTLALGVLFMG